MKTISKNRILPAIIAVFIMAAALSLLLPDFAFADIAPSLLSMEVEYGFNDSAKGGRYLPLNIRVDNNTGVDYQGELCIYTKAEDQEIYEYSESTTIYAEGLNEKTYYIPLAVNATSLLVEIKDDNGTQLIRKTIGLNIEKNTAQLFTGILSDSPESLEYFDNASINYGLLRSKVTYLDSSMFPEDAMGLDQLDVILISNYTIRDLSEIQTRALRTWVNDGGVMILGTGERVDDTLGRFAPELLDDMYEEPQLTTVDLLGSGEEAELYCVDVPLHGGNTAMESGDLSLLTSVNKGKGAIVVCAYDFVDAYDFAQEHQAYGGDVLTRSLGERRMEELAGEMYGGGSSEYDSVSRIVNNGDADRLPPLGIYMLSILAYILLAGPGIYLFLKHREASSYYRIGVIILSIFFTALIIIMGTRTRFEDTFYNYVSIIDTDEDKVSETSYLNLRNPYNKSYTVALGDDYLIFPVSGRKSNINIAEDWDQPFEANTVVAKINGENSVSVEDVGAFTPRIFKMTKTGENAEGTGFIGEINIFGDSISGSITNNFGQDVKKVSIVTYGRLVMLGDMADGETVDLDGLEVINIPLGDSETVAGLIAGVDEYEETDNIESDYLRAVARKNVLAFYHENYLAGYSTEARVIGLASDDSQELIKQKNLTGYGMKLLSSTVTLDNWNEEGESYISAMVKSPVCISGRYSDYDNTMGAMEPVVLEYQIGEEIEVNSLVFEWADKEIFEDAFTGSFAFYNIATGSYDSMDTGIRAFNATELAPYLKGDNTITVKYTYDAAAPVERISLPTVSVIGYEY